MQPSIVFALLAGLAERVGGLALVLGALTRPAALVNPFQRPKAAPWLALMCINGAPPFDC